MQKVNSSENVFIFADKTRNLYEVSPSTYHKLLTENITKSYKAGTDDIIDNINEELKEITSSIGISNHVDVMAKSDAFITLKDHKDNFDTKPKCRLINPAKSELGKASKVILDTVNDDIRSKIKVNQWKNSQSVIEWFRKISNKPGCTFVSFDIVEFYPSITEELLDKAILWARSFVDISGEHVSTIKHARKSLLFNTSKPWIKRTDDNLFDVTMGSFDGAEVCELVGLYVLNTLVNRFGNKNIGLYRDDGLALIKGTSGRLADRMRKDLCAQFLEFGLKITAEVNHQVVNFLDITFNLREESYRPYRKPNNDPFYINRHSNHPPSITKQLPASINKRISSLSFDKSTFDSVADTYEKALHQSNYNVQLEYSTDTPTTNSQRRKRTRNIIWFNPPFSKNVRSNIARIFLQLIDKHFPKTNQLHKIFNRNTIKVSYSCMGNIRSFISRHNKRILTTTEKPQSEQKSCNCRTSEDCPLQQNCLIKSIVYKAEIKSNDDGETREYIGMTANAFKSRFYNHKKSFNDVRYENETELSKYVWKLKRNERDFDIKWSILKRAPAYTAGGKNSHLCLEEKLCLLNASKETALNKRSELFAKCRHRNKFLARTFKRARALCKETVSE